MLRTDSSRQPLPLESAIAKLASSIDRNPHGAEGRNPLAEYEVSKSWRGLKLKPPLPPGASLTPAQASRRRAGLESLSREVTRTIAKLKVNVGGTALLKAIHGGANLKHGHLETCLQWLKYAATLNVPNSNLRQAEQRAKAVGELVRYLAARGEQVGDLGRQSDRVEAALLMLQSAMPDTAENVWRSTAPLQAAPQAVTTKSTAPASLPPAPLQPADDHKSQRPTPAGPLIAFGPAHGVPQSSQAAQQAERSTLITTTTKTLLGDRPAVVLRADVAAELAALVVDGALAGRGTLADLTRHADAVVMEHYASKRSGQLYKPAEDPTITAMKKPFRDFYVQHQAQVEARKHAGSGSAPAARVRMIQSPQTSQSSSSS